MQKQKSSLKTVELFSGIGGFRLACDKLGIKTIWANDIDDDACTVYTDRFGTKKLVKGDINDLINKVPAHDLLTAGFPCQPFSSAGKKQGIQDPRGTLFEAIIKILKKHHPKYFVLENVKRLLEMDSGRHFATILAALADLDDYLIEWRVVNTMYFGLPQNRNRIIIVGRYRDEEPGKRAILLSEGEESLLSTPLELFNRGSWKEITDHGKSFPHWGIAHKGYFFGSEIREFQDSKPLTTLVNFLEKDVSQEFIYADTKERLKNSVYVNRVINGIQILYNQKGGARMGYTVFGIEGLAPTLTSSTSRHYERYMIGGVFRRLTNVEYARIQGFPDSHCSAVSVYNQYKLYGNALAPAIALWAIKSLTKNKGIIINQFRHHYSAPRLNSTMPSSEPAL